MEETLQYLSSSTKGIKRAKNQDKVFIYDHEHFYLFGVFDGVSSISTSHIFIDIFIRKLTERLEHLSANGGNLAELLYQTHSETLEKGSDGMSTVSLLFYSKAVSAASIVNIGDSRIYAFTNQFIEKMTSDDNLPNRSNVLTKCLGIDDLNVNDFRPSNIQRDLNFLLCTDGFYKLMADNLKEYFKTYNYKKLHNIGRKLSTLQRKRNLDDSSYILIKT
jgi:serine/threonine protein phosphatase PrpC